MKHNFQIGDFTRLTKDYFCTTLLPSTKARSTLTNKKIAGTLHDLSVSDLTKPKRHDLSVSDLTKPKRRENSVDIVKILYVVSELPN